MMKIRVFVTGSAAFFAAWLVLTYVREVPHENYPRLGRGSLPVSAEVTPAATGQPAEAVVALPTEIARVD